MKTSSYILILTICLLYANCKSKDNDTFINLPKITIDIDKLETIKFHDLFSTMELIPLETSDSCLLGIIYPLLTENLYLMRDNTQQQISVFDKNGKFKYKIAHRGAAPDQYRYLTEIRLNPFTGNILLIESPDYIHEYDLNGTFLKKTRIDSITDIKDIIPINKDSLIITSNNKLTDYYYFYSSKQNKILSHIKDSTYHQAAYKFFRKGDHLFSYKWFDRIIYNIENHQFKPSYILDFGKYNHRQKNYSNIFQYMYENRHNEESDRAVIENFNYIIHDIQENDKYLFITIKKIKKNSADIQILNIVYNKETKKSSILNPSKEGIILNSWNEILTNNYYITSFDAINKDNLNSNLLDKNNKDKYDRIDENDNPVIIKYKFK